MVQRRNGESASDAADYQRLGKVYIGGKGSPERRHEPHFTEHRMFAPASAPDWVSDADEVWRMAALAERRCDANEGRILVVTLPRAFSSEAQLRDSVTALAKIFLDMNLIVQSDLHVPQARDGLPNPHCHFLISTRAVSADGFHKKKCLELEKLFRSRRGRLLRECICEIINDLAVEFGLPAQVHPESNYELDLEPVLEIRIPRYVFLSPNAPKNKATLENLDALRNRKNIPVLVAELQALEDRVASLNEDLERLRSEDIVFDPIPQMKAAADRPAQDPTIATRYLRKIEEEYLAIRNDGGRKGKLARHLGARSSSGLPSPEVSQVNEGPFFDVDPDASSP